MKCLMISLWMRRWMTKLEATARAVHGGTGLAAALVLLAGLASGGLACGPTLEGDELPDAELSEKEDEVGDTCACPPVTVAATPSVTLGPDGQLQYRTTALGDKVPDFSSAGYRGGGVALPVVPVVRTLSPISGDAQAMIQRAINEVSALPRDSRGFRGAILLRRGVYRIAGSLFIRASGVVLRGEGDGANGTVLLATGTSRRTLLRIEGGALQPARPTHTITDRYVPVGARAFNVESTAGLRVGDTIIVERPSTAAWIHDIGMDRIPPRPDGGEVQQWEPGAYNLQFERVITAMNGTRVFIDAPLVNSLDARYGGGTITRYTTSRRIEEVGIENLRGDSVFTGPEDEEHAWDFMEFSNVANAWVTNVTGIHFAHSVVMVSGDSKAMTVRNVKSLEPISQMDGDRRYAFHIVQGHGLLFYKCQSWNSRHDFVTGSRVTGPNVFLEGQAFDTVEVGPHHRWATGTLFDNIVVRGSGSLSAYNRSNQGSGQGWSGANQVFWNSEAPSMTCESPPTAQNWNVGSVTARPSRQCLWESLGTRAPIASLYRAQLAQRLGVQAVRNLDATAFATPAPPRSSLMQSPQAASCRRSDGALESRTESLTGGQ
jgi:hypothetical protein